MIIKYWKNQLNTTNKMVEFFANNNTTNATPISIKKYITGNNILLLSHCPMFSPYKLKRIGWCPCGIVPTFAVDLGATIL